MTDKRDAVVAAARRAAESMAPVEGKHHWEAMQEVKRTLAALDSPLPSDSELRIMDNTGENWIVGRRAVYAHALRLAADNLVGDFTDVMTNAGRLRAWADEMEGCSNG